MKRDEDAVLEIPYVHVSMPLAPPDREYWVEQEDVIRHDDGSVYPDITIASIKHIFGLTHNERHLITHYILYRDEFKYLSKGNGNVRQIDLYTLEKIAERMRGTSRMFGTDRFVMAKVMIRNIAYMYGYIDARGNKTKPDPDRVAKDRRRIDEANRRKIRKVHADKQKERRTRRGRPL